MKITVEIDMDDSVPPALTAQRFHTIAGYAAGFISTCHVKPGRIEVHETGVFGSVYSEARNVKITIDRSE